MRNVGQQLAASFPRSDSSDAWLADEALATEEAAFVARHPGLFLLADALAPGDEDPEAERTQVAGAPVADPGAKWTLITLSKRDQQNPCTWLITIGRSRTNDILLAHASISRLHAWIRRHSDERGRATFTITDAGSRNGTRVDGAELRGETAALELGARLQLGEITLQFLDGAGVHRVLRGGASVEPRRGPDGAAARRR